MISKKQSSNLKNIELSRDIISEKNQESSCISRSRDLVSEKNDFSNNEAND